MDIFSLLMGARVTDSDGNEYNEVVAVHYVNGRLGIVLRAEMDDDEYEDDDDPEREDIPEPVEFPKIRAVAGDKKH